MAEEELKYLKMAHNLYHSKPRPDDLVDQLDELARMAGGTTVEERMIGSLVSAATMDEANGHV